MRHRRRADRVANPYAGPATIWAAGGCAALLLSGVSLAADDDPRAWLARTDQALANRNYEGVFVHEHGGDSETLRVIHRVGSDGVSERLLSMDGSGREFIRRGTQLTCYLPDKRLVLVEKSSDGGLLLASLPRADTGAAGQYRITELTRTRASGRKVRVIAITPTDALRYGYRVWIDEASAMPVRTQLRSHTGEVLEQLVFTDLRLPAHISDSELQPAVDTRGYTFVHQDSDSTDSSPLSVTWEASLLPPGFTMTTSARQMLPAGPVEHLVFTDGMASVSVFVAIGRSSQTLRDDAARLGTSSAYSTTVQGYRVTAVGEVPPETVRAIAQSIRAATSTVSPVYTYEAIELPLAPALHSNDTGSIFDQAPASNPSDRNVEHRGNALFPHADSSGSTSSAFGSAPPMSAFGPSSGAAQPRH
jgi:sigma-E factor negative regulatory protein RseB